MARGKRQIKITANVELTIEQAAAWFADLDDDLQAQFFVNVARIAAETYEGTPQSQWIRIGDHLTTCECSSDAGREMIRDITYGMDNPWSSKTIETDLLAKAMGQEQPPTTETR